MHLDNIPQEYKLSSQFLTAFSFKLKIISVLGTHEFSIYTFLLSLDSLSYILSFIKNSIRMVPYMENLWCAMLSFSRENFHSILMFLFNLWWDRKYETLRIHIPSSLRSKFQHSAQSQMGYIIHKQIILMEISHLFTTFGGCWSFTGAESSAYTIMYSLIINLFSRLFFLLWRVIISLFRAVSSLYLHT